MKSTQQRNSDLSQAYESEEAPCYWAILSGGSCKKVVSSSYIKPKGTRGPKQGSDPSQGSALDDRGLLSRRDVTS